MSKKRYFFEIDSGASSSEDIEPVRSVEDFSNRGLGDEDCKIIANLVENNTTIKTLDLSNNYITKEGLKPIIKALETNKTLLKICLDQNKIEEGEETYIITQLLKINQMNDLVSQGVEGVENSEVKEEPPSQLASEDWDPYFPEEFSDELAGNLSDESSQEFSDDYGIIKNLNI